jgi:hypothetical protein
MTDTLVTIAGLLADEAPKDTGPDFGKASPFGLLIVVLLLIGTFLLVRSMNRHLKQLPKSFDGRNPAPDRVADGETVESDTDGKAVESDTDGKAVESDTDGETVESDTDGKAP